MAVFHTIVAYGLGIGFVVICCIGGYQWYREITKYERECK